MTLVYDKRNELKGGPGLHALIVGISHYKYLQGGTDQMSTSVGLGQLSTAARSAYAVYEWLQRARLHVPLATVRLLMSPSPDESTANPKLAELSGPSGLEQFLTAAYEWRLDADAHRDGYTLFYFAGNGVLVNRSDTALLLEDFGDRRGAPLRNAVGTQNLVDGMAPSRSRSSTARTQLYFIDTSRNTPEWLGRSLFSDPSPIFDIEVSRSRDDRIVNCFYATSPSAFAYAYTGGLSLFSQELIRCLEGDGATPVETGASSETEEQTWGITVSSLSTALSQRMRELSESLGVNQMVRIDSSGQGADAVINYLEGAPQTKLELIIDPVEAHEFASVKITDWRNEVVVDLPAPLKPHPYTSTLPAGIYLVSVSFDSSTPYQGSQRVRAISPPAAKIRMKVN
jgi:hypothetical protein